MRMTRYYSYFVLIFFLVIALFTSCTLKKGTAYLYVSFREPATQGLKIAYSNDAHHWTDLKGIWLSPKVGTQHILRDPSVCMGPDNLYHLVWTCSWRGDRGFGYSESSDFIHWSKEKFIEVMPDTSTVNVWAPELFFDRDSDQYIIIWASTIPHRFPKGIEDEKNNHRLYLTTTKDFVHYTPSRLFFDPGYSVIDGQIIQLSSKTYALLFKDNTRNELDLKVAFSASPYGPFGQISKAFTGYKTEGPAAVHVHGTYLVYYDAYGQKKFGSVATTDFKKFQEVSSDIQLPQGHKHGTIISVPQKVVNHLIEVSKVKQD